MEHKQPLKQHPAHRLTLTQALARSLQILEMPQLELAALIEEEVEKNPLLEIESLRPKTRLPQAPVETAAKISLYEHLLAQVRESFPHPKHQRIAEQFIEHLDERGFLTSTPNHVDAEQYLKILQTFDPPGIFARSLQESFLLQLPINSLAYKIVSFSFDDLLQGRYTQIKKKLRITAEQLSDAIHTLSRLSTRPAASFESTPIQLIQPDLRIFSVGRQWIVEAIEENLPALRLNTDYLSLPNLPPSEKETLRHFTVSAKWLIRSIQKRKKFLLSLASYLVRKQSPFLNQKGELALISPKELAEKFSVHESTIYRALSEKYLATPTGLIRLAALAPTASNELAKDLLKKLISQEDKQAPLTDDQISMEMKKAGCEIARRTIAKYRKELKIRSASSRKHLS